MKRKTWKPYQSSTHWHRHILQFGLYNIKSVFSTFTIPGMRKCCESSYPREEKTYNSASAFCVCPKLTVMNIIHKIYMVVGLEFFCARSRLIFSCPSHFPYFILWICNNMNALQSYSNFFRRCFLLFCFTRQTK